MARKRKTQKQLALPNSQRRKGGEALIEDASLSDEAQRRYLNYALSVITSRALPDVRDGLKPVQRRILYAMLRELSLRHDGRYKKSAGVVGEVMAKYHPHGDQAIYDTMVRMAQTFSLRACLVDGRGNFGSPDGDPPAAMRYTEAKLTALAEELLSELGQDTVDSRPTYDGERVEPVVLPARFPNLLVNGSYGIAVGMATSIPTHNLGEVIKALIAMVDKPALSLKQALRHIKGPDFPTGGELVATGEEIEAVYQTGQGSLKLRGTWKTEDVSRGQRLLVIDSIPFAVERRQIVEKIFEIVSAKKLGGILDIRDESTDQCRIVCELKRDADEQLIMAYLYRHTPLRTSVQFNLTCLVPADHPIAMGTEPATKKAKQAANAGEDAAPELPVPRRLGLLQILRAFLDFRMEVVTRRLRHDLRELEKRIHVLEGFETVFDALDETIRIIRRSEGRQDAAQKLMKRFSLDEVQVGEILSLRLYRLAKLQILLIREELEAKRKEAKRIVRLLKSEKLRWAIVRDELTELSGTFAEARLTSVVADTEEPDFDAEDFIAEEDAMVVCTQQGWVKRQQKVKDVATTRVRDGDAVLSIVAGSTRSSVAFFSNLGVCYVARIVDIPATTGYGSPVQTMFGMKDGERIIAVMGFDPRIFEVSPPSEDKGEPEPPFAIAATKRGMGLRFSLRNHRDPSTKSGRKYARPRANDEVVLVDVVDGDEQIAVASKKGRALICEVDDVSILSGAGKGVTLIKLQPDDAVLGAAVLASSSDRLSVEKEKGTRLEISTRKYGVVGRGGKGFQLFKRGTLSRAIPPEVDVPPPLDGET